MQAKFQAAMDRVTRSSDDVAPGVRIAFAQATADVLFNFDQRILQYYTDIQMQNPSLKPGGGIYKELKANLDVSCPPHHPLVYACRLSPPAFLFRRSSQSPRAECP